ncbi:MAG: hypothetical protein JWO32_1894 [Bacteroidetes bacterium]|nr:hypothetical protein [Bacteroidota bacterium]
MSSKKYSISKSSFLKFEQCAKSFFLYKNHPYLRDKLSVDKQLTFRRGHDIGFFAQQLFPGGIDVSKETKNAMEAYELTKTLIDNKTPVIYEATFIYKDVLVMVDILHYENGIFIAYEIKSSIKVSETYLRDACLQYFVLKNSLTGFEDLFLTTMNGDYVMDETIDPKKLFKKRSVKKEAEKNLEYFEKKIEEAVLILEMNAIPNITIGKHCFKPYACDFFGTCWKDVMNEKSVFNLPFIGKEKLFEWYDAGVKNIEAIESSEIENPKHLKIKDSFISNTPYIQPEKIAVLLNTIKEPVAALDMEIWSSALPQLKGTRPFQQIPFLFCIADETTESHFLTEHILDERKTFAEELIKQTKKYNTLLVFDKTMEELAIKGLKEMVPALSADLEEVKNKFVDLFEVFRNLYYYHPHFKNNFSLKTISEVFETGVTYTGIQSGLEAMNHYEEYRKSEEGIEKQLNRDQLINYCMNDAQATLKLAHYLQNLVK